LVSLVLRLGLAISRSYLPKAEAAWLTSWSLDVMFVGLTSMEAPLSSNSKSPFPSKRSKSSQSKKKRIEAVAVKVVAIEVIEAVAEVEEVDLVLGVAGVSYALESHGLVGVVPSARDIEGLVHVTAVGLLLVVLGDLVSVIGHGGSSGHHQHRYRKHRR
jgi:hypothetical protein